MSDNMPTFDGSSKQLIRLARLTALPKQ